jgi:fructuronate reductase
MRYVTGVDEKGGAIDVRDPLAGALRKIADMAGPKAERLAPALIAIESIFGTDLAFDPRFVTAVTEKLEALFNAGAMKTVSDA